MHRRHTRPKHISSIIELYYIMIIIHKIIILCGRNMYGAPMLQHAWRIRLTGGSAPGPGPKSAGPAHRAPRAGLGPLPPPRRGGVFHGATAYNIGSLDPATASDEASGPILQLVFARLVTWDERGEIAPDLAPRKAARAHTHIHMGRGGDECAKRASACVCACVRA